jgi:hypothetical protein
MAAKIQSNSMHKGSSKIKRPGVHAKSKTSKNKNSKNYAKPYVAQGR